MKITLVTKKGKESISVDYDEFILQNESKPIIISQSKIWVFVFLSVWLAFEAWLIYEGFLCDASNLTIIAQASSAIGLLLLAKALKTAYKSSNLKYSFNDNGIKMLDKTKVLSKIKWSDLDEVKKWSKILGFCLINGKEKIYVPSTVGNPHYILGFLINNYKRLEKVPIVLEVKAKLLSWYGCFIALVTWPFIIYFLLNHVSNSANETVLLNMVVVVYVLVTIAICFLNLPRQEFIIDKDFIKIDCTNNSYKLYPDDWYGIEYKFFTDNTDSPSSSFTILTKKYGDIKLERHDFFHIVLNLHYLYGVDKNLSIIWERPEIF